MLLLLRDGGSHTDCITWHHHLQIWAAAAESQHKVAEDTVIDSLSYNMTRVRRVGQQDDVYFAKGDDYLFTDATHKIPWPLTVGAGWERGKEAEKQRERKWETEMFSAIIVPHARLQLQRGLWRPWPPKKRVGGGPKRVPLINVLWAGRACLIFWGTTDLNLCRSCLTPHLTKQPLFVQWNKITFLNISQKIQAFVIWF